MFMRHKKRRSRRFDLEKEYGFRLVIHERDWIAGRTIRANITDSIEKSRRVIFIISRYGHTKFKTPRLLLNSRNRISTMWLFSFWDQHKSPSEIVAPFKALFGLFNNNCASQNSETISFINNVINVVIYSETISALPNSVS